MMFDSRPTVVVESRSSDEAVSVFMNNWCGQGIQWTLAEVDRHNGVTLVYFAQRKEQAVRFSQTSCGDGDDDAIRAAALILAEAGFASGCRRTLYQLLSQPTNYQRYSIDGIKEYMTCKSR